MNLWGGLMMWSLHPALISTLIQIQVGLFPTATAWCWEYILVITTTLFILRTVQMEKGQFVNLIVTQVIWLCNYTHEKCYSIIFTFSSVKTPAQICPNGNQFYKNLDLYPSATVLAQTINGKTLRTTTIDVPLKSVDAVSICHQQGGEMLIPNTPEQWIMYRAMMSERQYI